MCGSDTENHAPQDKTDTIQIRGNRAAGRMYKYISEGFAQIEAVKAMKTRCGPCFGWLAAGLVLLLPGCQTIEQSMPQWRDFSQKESDRVGTAVATQPTGRDLDREKLVLSRKVGSLSDYAIRVYENRDGRFVIDEKYTVADGKRVVEYLSGQDRKHLRHGVVYLISQSKIANENDFVAIKAFCIERNVDMYIADSMNIRNIWTQGRPSQWDDSVAGEVSWIVQARP